MNGSDMKAIGHGVSGKPGTFAIEGDRMHLFRLHKYPMALLEEVSECNAEQNWLKGSKKVRAEDPYVQAHFPENPFMPPAFVVEGLAQAAGALMNILFFFDRGIRLWEISGDELLTLGQPPYNVLAESRIKHLGLALPGDTIALHVKVMLRRKDIIAFQAEAFVKERLIARGEMMLAYPSYTPVIVPERTGQGAAIASH